MGLRPRLPSLHVNVPNSPIHNSQKVETTQIREEMNG